MATLLDKVTTLISANLHALVDQALKSNNIAVVDQYIRQVERHLDDLLDAAATVGGEVKSIRRTLEELEQKTAELDRAIDAFLVRDDEAAATAAQGKLNSTRRLTESYQEQMARLETEYQKLLDARARLEARLTTMKQQREELQALLELARSKETTVKAIKSLDSLVGSGDADVGRIAQGIYARLDKATTAAEMQSASLDEQIDDVLYRGAIDSQLAERRQKLGLNT
jgi:phage shock protein A